MTSIIKADNGVISGITGITQTADNSGVLELQATGNVVSMTNVNGAVYVPVGTTEQRPASASNGAFRYNSNSAAFEGYANGTWGSIGGSGGGAVASGVINLNNQTVLANYSFTANTSGVSAGPVTLSPNVTVTMPLGSRWVIL